jgi:release factor glutamine methyltransferase
LTVETGPIEAAHAVGEALALMARRLQESGIEEPRREARMLAAAALGLDLAGLILHEGRPVGDAAARANAMLARRAAHEPLSRIRGEREFYGLPLGLNAATLDPRPDTETLVDAVLDHLAAAGGGHPRILDLGTGTGALLLALLSRLPAARGIGIDIATDAVEMARNNARSLGLGDRAVFRAGDMMQGLDTLPGFDILSPDGVFDAIVSNPPYIPSADIAGLAPEVRLFDPVQALDGGADGLDFYRRIAADAPALLVPGGLVALEVGAGQASAVAGLLDRGGLMAIDTRRDLAGIERVVSGQTRARL